MSNQAWQVLDGGGNNQGPYSLQDLQGYYTSGNISHDTLVWTEGLAGWTPAGQIEGLLPPVPVAAYPQAPYPHTAYPTAQQQAPAAPARQGAPPWLGITTLVLGLAALVFFFLPWVSISINPDPSTNSKLVKASTQSGFQAITTNVSVSNEFVSLTAKAAAESGKDQGKIKKDLREDLGKGGDKEWGMSVFSLVAFLAIGVAVMVCLIGLLNKLPALVIVAQSLLALAAVLIGIQMALQFPMVQAFVEKQTETRKELEAEIKRASEVRETVGDPNEEMADINRARRANLFETSFEPACFATIGLLSLGIFLVVITMSTANSSPLVVPPGNYQPGQSPPQPQQPGGGLRFH